MAGNKIKLSNKIPDWVYEEADKKGLSYSVIYHRWRFELSRVNKVKNSINWANVLQELPTRRSYSKRGGVHGFRLPIEYENRFKNAVLKSGKTKLDFVAELVIQFLDNL